MRIILIAGGWSSEREVSLSGARGIGQAIKRLGHELVDFDLSDGLDAMLRQAKACDCAFINLHGAPGEDGLVQAMLDRIGCPYQGSGPAGSFLALHKAASKEIIRLHSLATPDWAYLPDRPEPGWRPDFGFPVFTKPNVGGSSLGMSMVANEAELGPALDLIYDMGEEPLVEQLVRGVEITCAVLDEEPLPPILIRPKKGEFFDYESKYVEDGAEEICPAPVPDEVTRAVQEASLKAHQVLGLRGVSRADFILDQDTGEPILLEVNTLPGMTPTSLLPKAAAAAGMNFDQLIQRLIDIGIRNCTNTGKGR